MGKKLKKQSGKEVFPKTENKIESKLNGNKFDNSNVDASLNKTIHYHNSEEQIKETERTVF